VQETRRTAHARGFRVERGGELEVDEEGAVAAHAKVREREVAVPDAPLVREEERARRRGGSAQSPVRSVRGRGQRGNRPHSRPIGMDKREEAVGEEAIDGGDKN
jgi:hypothetical protein